jgi:TPR repeat protein
MESLGEFYIGGFGVKVDHEEGLMWLERAADQGSADACFALGDYYFKGYGKEPNHLLAKDWWEKAIDLGSDAAEMIYEKYFGKK